MIPTTGMSSHHEDSTDPKAISSIAMKSNSLITFMPYYQCLMDNISEGVIFIDANCTIRNWNKGAQSLTGLGSAVLGRRLEPSLLRLRDANQKLISNSNSPFEKWVDDQKEVMERFYISGRSGRDAQVDLQFLPVQESEGAAIGGIILLRDTSMQVELQRQLNDLYAIATLDPLTQVANRAEFERILDDYIATHREANLACSIIVCDIDFFKKINDGFGHHVGDQALIAFAAMLKKHVRPHDFVARYGGEEFVILCGHCTEEAASERAESIRKLLETTQQPMLADRPMTASFGVAVLETSDTGSSLFVRADKALLKAKEKGRNRTVKASDLANSNKALAKRGKVDSVCSDVWRDLPEKPLLVREFCTPTILVMFSERLKACAVNLDARIIQVSEMSVTFRLTAQNPKKPSNRAVMNVDIDLADPERARYKHHLPKGTRLLARIAITPRRSIFQRGDLANIAEGLMKQIREELTLGKGCELAPNGLTDSDNDRYGHP